MAGQLKAQEPAEQKQPEAGETQRQARKLPLEVAGYLGFRHLNDDPLDEHHFYREYSGSLFLSKTIGRWRFHTELNASTDSEYDAQGIHILDPLPNLSVKIDNASVNYNWRDWLQADAGFIFIPTYWRNHRYQSTTLVVDEPLIDQNVFPTAFKGFAVRGDRFFNDGGFSYQVYGGVSQEGHFSDAEEIEKSRALGGKLVLHLPSRQFLDTFDIGFHRLKERYSGSWHESHGWEVRVEKGRVGFLGEYAHTSIKSEGRRRNRFREGFYLQPFYRITPKLAAVVSYDFLNRSNRQPTKNALARQSAGLTYRPLPAVSLKFEADRYEEQRGRLPAYYGASIGVVYFFRLR